MSTIQPPPLRKHLSEPQDPQQNKRRCVSCGERRRPGFISQTARPIASASLAGLFLCEPHQSALAPLDPAAMAAQQHRRVLILILLSNAESDCHVLEVQRVLRQHGLCSGVSVAIVTYAGAGVRRLHNPYDLPVVADSSGALIRALGAMHPMGGGRYPLDAVAFVDGAGARRGLCPITAGAYSRRPGKNYVLSDIESLLLSAIDYFSYEQ